MIKLGRVALGSNAHERANCSRWCGSTRTEPKQVRPKSRIDDRARACPCGPSSSRADVTVHRAAYNPIRGDDAVDDKALWTEITKLRRIIAAAAKKAAQRDTLIDKLTAAQLHVELLMKRLRRGGRRRAR
jgi:hypothetical protein